MYYRWRKPGFVYRLFTCITSVGENQDLQRFTCKQTDKQNLFSIVCLHVLRKQIQVLFIVCKQTITVEIQVYMFIACLNMYCPTEIHVLFTFV